MYTEFSEVNMYVDGSSRLRSQDQTQAGNGQAPWLGHLSAFYKQRLLSGHTNMIDGVGASCYGLLY